MNDSTDYNISTDDLCHTLGIARRTLWDRIQKRGIFAAKRVGRRWYFSSEVYKTPLARPG